MGDGGLVYWVVGLSHHWRLTIDRLSTDHMTIDRITIDHLTGEGGSWGGAPPPHVTRLNFCNKWPLGGEFHQWRLTTDWLTTDRLTTDHFQHQKAVHMKNDTAAFEILLERDPLKMKQIGDGLGTSNDWETAAPRILKTAVLTKFGQNSDLLEALKSTGARRFAESTHDRTWGTGMTLGNEHADDESHWKGKNLMGHILDDVRLQL